MNLLYHSRLSAKPQTLVCGECYKDDIGVLCRRWNWREGERTMLREDTKNAVLVIESLAPIPQSVAENATNELAELVKKYCGGEIQVHFLDDNNREADITS